MTRARGGQSRESKRVTVTLAPPHAERLQELADEAGVPLTTYLNHIVARYAMQPNESISGDVIAEKLDKSLNKFLRQFDKRYSDVILRIAHEVVAHRHMTYAQEEIIRPNEGNELRELGWKHAVKSLRPFSENFRTKEDGEVNE